MIQNQVVDSNKEWEITFSDEIVFDSNIKNNIIVRDKDEVVPIDILIKETNLPLISNGFYDIDNNELWVKYSNGQEELLVTCNYEIDCMNFH